MQHELPLISPRHRLADTLRGIYHFLGDRTPKEVDIAPAKPRKKNPFCKDGMALVSKVQVEHDLVSSITRSMELIGGLEKVISPGDRVMVKPNFNSADPYPGSTDLDFLKAVVRLLVEAGAKVIVGESAGGIWRPTNKVLEKAGVLRLLTEMGVEVTAFEDRSNDWVRVKIEGEYLHEVTVPRSAYEVDRMVYLPCMKTHRLARFSLSLKLAVGFMHPGERRALHLRNLEHKVAELSLVWQPDLIIMDGRRAFVSGGPENGELVEPGVIMTSGDLVAIDVEALKILASYKAKNRLMPNPLDSPQIATALRHGLGSKEYQVIV
ncbi:MAG: hypothetical protein AMJ37_00535 [Dehalococcoidia bacterium DG_18]|nr:MAG: hypothetical protein AMJ37_00535 [Dehalococcoidia bacterium DG_18]